ncbi:IspD/TarI family cytidylyltransferase [Pseudonocardia sp.]|uniref:IspD/TarI family cytidylyltransferase n=1 Tax=Pseudonocardia sp. TaxID=60912 RepID=UPI00341FDD01
MEVAGGTAAALVLAGGSGTRVGAARNKVFLPVAGRSVIAWSLDTLAGAPGIGPVVLVVRPEDRDLARTVIDRETAAGDVEIVDGGATRQDSELAGLRALADRIACGRVDVVLVHDGARPLVTRALVAEVLSVAREVGGAVPGMWRDDLAEVSDTGGLRVPARLVAVQTPQGFRAAPLLAAYERAAAEGFVGTDTASCVARYAPGTPVLRIAGEPRNVKITYAHDVQVTAGGLIRRGIA